MKGIRTLLCVISLAFSSVVMSDVMAQKDLFNSCLVGVGVGTIGVDVNVATPITSHFALRGGLSFMPNFITDVTDGCRNGSGRRLNVPSTINVKGNIKRVSENLLVGYVRLKEKVLSLTAGAYFGGELY